MNNIIISVKKFLQNKNVVTVLGVIIIMAILYFGYNAQLRSQVAPVQVPVAKRTLQPKEMITRDVIEYISVPSIGVNSKVVTNAASLIGKYVDYDTTIPQGSMFYGETIVTEDALPDSAFTQVKEGEIVYQFAVDMESTFGNSIYPGNKVDLYMKATNDEGLLMVGKFIENVEVLAVKDSSGRNVFENSAENRVPAYLVFGVSEDLHILLRKAQYLNSNNIDLFPVPHGGTVDTEGKTQVSTQLLRDFIESKTVNIPIENNNEGA